MKTGSDSSGPPSAPDLSSSDDDIVNISCLHVLYTPICLGVNIAQLASFPYAVLHLISFRCITTRS